MTTECANIGPRGVRLRALAGAAGLVVGLAIAVWLIRADVHPLWRLVLLPVFWFAGLGFFQARAKV